MSNIRAIRGMNDILPDETPLWQHLEQTVARLVASYGYGEIRLPVVEQTELFKRSIGEVTDIVEKEMYTFDDRNGDSLTLRPEGTAGCVRAGIQQGILNVRSASGMRARCSGTSDPKRAGSASFTRSGSRPSAWPRRTWMRK